MRKDIHIGFKRHPVTKDFAIVKDGNAIRQSLKNIIYTNLYERGFNTVGASLSYYLFEINDELMRSALADEIKKLLTEYEPSITVTKVLVYSENDTDIKIIVLYNEYNEEEEQTLTIPVKRV